jgi:hypothetical protein
MIGEVQPGEHDELVTGLDAMKRISPRGPQQTLSVGWACERQIADSHARCPARDVDETTMLSCCKLDGAAGVSRHGIAYLLKGR